MELNIEKDIEKKNITFYLEISVIDKIKTIAAINNCSLNKAIAALITEKFNERIGIKK